MSRRLRIALFQTIALVWLMPAAASAQGVPLPPTLEAAGAPEHSRVWVVMGGA